MLKISVQMCCFPKENFIFDLGMLKNFRLRRANNSTLFKKINKHVTQRGGFFVVVFRAAKNFTLVVLCKTNSIVFLGMF